MRDHLVTTPSRNASLSFSFSTKKLILSLLYPYSFILAVEVRRLGSFFSNCSEDFTLLLALPSHSFNVLLLLVKKYSTSYLACSTNSEITLKSASGNFTFNLYFLFSILLILPISGSTALPSIVIMVSLFLN